MKPVVLGSRGSALALAQTKLVQARLQQAHPSLAVEVCVIRTHGDRFPTASLSSGETKGWFTREIEEALLAGRVDAAVHSLKDLPTTLPDGLVLAGVLERADPRDVLVSVRYDSLEALPRGARVGTGSLRRRAQLLHRRPDLQIEPIRGNVETRLHKVVDGEFDAVVLAAAGLHRLGCEVHGVWLSTDVMLPAVGQGLIGIEIRAGDTRLRELVAGVNVAEAWACALAERAFLRGMGGGCQMPYAALATVDGEQLILTAGVFSPDGRVALRRQATGLASEAEALGQQVAADLSAEMRSATVARA